MRPFFFLVLLVLTTALLLSGCRAESPAPLAVAADNLAPAETALPSATTRPAGPTVRITPGDNSPVTPQPAAPTTEPPPAASSTRAPELRSLTEGGCCVEPFWAPDSASLYYIDRPSADDPSGLWRVSLQGETPEFVTDRLGIFSADLRLRAFPSGGQTLVEDLQTGEQWRIPNDGRPVSFSPDGAWLAWTAGQSGPPFDRARREVWISRSDGSDAQLVFAALRGGFEGWFPDGRLLVSGSAAEGGAQQALWALDLENSRPDQPDLVELGRGGRLREAKISPGGGWLAYLVTFSDDPAQNGLWLADTHTGERRRLEQFGGYNWRDENHLLLVPLLLDQPLHWLIEIEAASGAAQVRTDPGQTPFKIANGDWQVSPDGQKLAFLSAVDGNIWLLELGDQ
jgi:Tol biopolymer transport system component